MGTISGGAGADDVAGVAAETRCDLANFFCCLRDMGGLTGGAVSVAFVADVGFVARSVARSVALVGAVVVADVASAASCALASFFRFWRDMVRGFVVEAMSMEADVEPVAGSVVVVVVGVEAVVVTEPVEGVALVDADIVADSVA